MIKLRNLFCFILTIVCFWYHISGTRNPATDTRNWYQILVPVFWYQFLVPVSGQYVMGIIWWSAAAGSDAIGRWVRMTDSGRYVIDDALHRFALIATHAIGSATLSQWSGEGRGLRVKVNSTSREHEFYGGVVFMPSFIVDYDKHRITLHDSKQSCFHWTFSCGFRSVKSQCSNFGFESDSDFCR